VILCNHECQCWTPTSVSVKDWSVGVTYIVHESFLGVNFNMQIQEKEMKYQN
jgi:hypothetical protein